MMIKIILACLFVWLLATAASAQTKISDTAKCRKPEPQYVLEVGDRANHAFLIAKGSCAWTKPLEMAGTENKGYEDTIFSESSGNKSSDRGYVNSSYANGDKTFIRFSGTGTLKDGKLVSQEGTWSYTAGTGKLKGIKGKGTYKCTPEGEGSTCDIEGEYELPK